MLSNPNRAHVFATLNANMPVNSRRAARANWSTPALNSHRCMGAPSCKVLIFSRAATSAPWAMHRAGTARTRVFPAIVTLMAPIFIGRQHGAAGARDPSCWWWPRGDVKSNSLHRGAAANEVLHREARMLPCELFSSQNGQKSAQSFMPRPETLEEGPHQCPSPNVMMPPAHA